MISIKRDRKEVRLDIEIDVPHYDNRILYFRWDAGNEMFAGLLAAEMDTQIRDRIQEIRRLEYERGFKEGRGKQKKKSWFYRSFTKSA